MLCFNVEISHIDIGAYPGGALGGPGPRGHKRGAKRKGKEEREKKKQEKKRKKKGEGTKKER